MKHTPLRGRLLMESMMAIHSLKLIRIFSIIAFCFFAILFFEWIVINAVLGCYSWHQILWVNHETCFTLKQLIGG